MGIRVRLCSDWCLRKADILSDYPQTSVSHIVRTQHFYFAQRDTAPACFGPFVTILKLLFQISFCDILLQNLIRHFKQLLRSFPGPGLSSVHLLCGNIVILPVSAVVAVV